MSKMRLTYGKGIELQKMESAADANQRHISETRMVAGESDLLGPAE